MLDDVTYLAFQERTHRIQGSPGDHVSPTDLAHVRLSQKLLSSQPGGAVPIFLEFPHDINLISKAHAIPPVLQ